MMEVSVRTDSRIEGIIVARIHVVLAVHHGGRVVAGALFLFMTQLAGIRSAHAQETPPKFINKLQVLQAQTLLSREDNEIEVHPLAPDTWHYLALVNVPYCGHHVSILENRTSTRYEMGTGMQRLVDGQRTSVKRTCVP